jgi:CheY-like chemotaxis protein
VDIVPQSDQSPPTPSVRSLRVLVADDDPVNRMIVKMLLGKRGHVVVAAVNGHEAVVAAAEGGFDVALMDVQMPDMDGLQATATIRTAEGVTGGHLPILALTADQTTDTRDACMTAGADGHLSKPIVPDDLFAAIDSILAGNQDASR